MLAQYGRLDLEPEYREERKVNPVRRRRASTEKAQHLLGFESKVGLAEGLRELIAWRRANKHLVLA
jgi:UDP-glucose 4-epimerase